MPESFAKVSDSSVEFLVSTLARSVMSRVTNFFFPPFCVAFSVSLRDGVVFPRLIAPPLTFRSVLLILAGAVAA